MTEQNQTSLQITEFFIVCFPDLQDWQSQAILFAIFSVAYIIALLGNLLFIMTVLSDYMLHTPMYILICNLAVLDICIPSVTVPSMLSHFVLSNRLVAFSACFIQMILYLGLGTTESFTLMIMAYDRYYAICKPLHYPSVMTNRKAIQLSVVCWIVGMMAPIIPFYFSLKLPFCGPYKVHHCFCDYAAVVKLACADVSFLVDFGLIIALLVLLIPLFFIILSYTKIIMTLLKMSTSEGHWKAFSTCASHLFVISIFILVAVFVFVSYKTFDFSEDVRILGAVLQNIFPPMVNPIIYCLRTKEIRDSFFRTIKNTTLFPKV
ncbi:olfactory receptor 6N1-like [Protopterus annectens]|uniref:olfactory receptor 6N1-like n=1 Tax=Protopterus annectens TaxID=7888 RepID=UPI001CFA0A52|nr:olfactory receptor 6N1-like [Protopterus annectens]